MTNSNEQQLYSERRVCPECLFSIVNPFVERCPRCLTAIPRMEVNCRSCIHHAVCPVASQSSALSQFDASRKDDKRH